MATRIFRVDLTDTARDFQHIALEPGLPLLDRAHVNAEILFKWVGILVADPEWRGDSVNFYIRDPEQGRLSEITVYPVKDEDLKDAKSTLRADIDELKRKLSKAQPETSTEHAVHRSASASLGKLKLNFDKEKEKKKKKSDLVDTSPREHSLFKYRFDRGPWRLVWCWGYQRRVQEPSPTLICTDPECHQLFLKLPRSKGKCPGCLKRPILKAKPLSKWISVFPLLLLLLLLLGGAGFWFLNQPKLVVMPGNPTLPIGSRTDFTVKLTTLFTSDDVTEDVNAVSNDNRVIVFESGTTTAKAGALGTTIVYFSHGDVIKKITVEVIDRGNPTELFFADQDGIRLEGVDDELPGLNVAIGATKQMKIMGLYGDDEEPFDLTDSDSLVLSAEDKSLVYFNGTLAQGKAEGTTTITAKYKAPGKNESVDASADLTVSLQKFVSLAMEVDPVPITQGQSSELKLTATDENGEKHSVTGSGLLNLKIKKEGKEFAKIIDNRYIKGLKPGEITVVAQLDGLDSEVEDTFNVEPGDLPFNVYPEELELVVGEKYEPKITAMGSYTLVSNDDAIVKITGTQDPNGKDEITAVAKGETNLVVTHTDKEGNPEEKTIKVVVNLPPPIGDIVALKFNRDDETFNVPLGGKFPFYIIGVDKDDNEVQIDIDSDKITWTPPREKYVQLFRESETYLQGVQITDDRPTFLMVSYKTQEGEKIELRKDVVVVPGVTEIADSEFERLNLLGGSWRHFPTDSLGDAALRSFTPGVVTSPDGGVVVTTLPSSGPYREVLSGLPPGTRLVSVGGMPINTARDFYDLSGRILQDRTGDIIIETMDPNGVAGTLRIRPDVLVVQKDLVDEPGDNIIVQLTVEARKETNGGEMRLIDLASSNKGAWQTMDLATRKASLTSSPIKEKLAGKPYPMLIELRLPDGRVKQYPYAFIVRKVIDDATGDGAGILVPGGTTIKKRTTTRTIRRSGGTVNDAIKKAL